MQIPAVLFTIAIFAVGHASAAAIQPRQDSGFSDFVTGAGSELFGNEGAPCTVGNDEGECDRFGRCAQFIPPNENSILNQGREVAECVEGGVVGILKKA
ncbi:hypothetical protein ACJ41O_014486 [Fusarium nematophilum]